MHFTFGTTRIAVNMADQATLLAEVAARFRARRGFALATINLDHLVKLQQSETFRTAYAAQDLVVADGNPIVWLSKLAGRPVALVPGSDLVLPLAQLAAKEGVGVALLGTTDAALSAAADHLMRHVPNLLVTLRYAPPMGFDPNGEDAARILAEMSARGVGLCFTALGAPKQEALAARGRVLAPQVGFASIGAGLDFLAGNQVRAPRWVRALALEWAWRMAQSPRRLIPRYVSCAAILPSQITQALRIRKTPAT